MSQESPISSSDAPGKSLLRTKMRRSGFLLALLGMFLTMAMPRAQAQSANSIKVIPTVTSITREGDKLVARGFASAVINGQTATAPFETDVEIRLAKDQSKAAAAGCPILDLRLGPINLNLLGLMVKTSPICLEITAYEGGGLLGDLLCGIADLLGGGLSLNQALGTLSATDLQALNVGLIDLFNEALGQLTGAALVNVNELNERGRRCAILNLELGPIELNLLGLVVELDNCKGGAVTVDITARRGALLGDLLCGLLGGGLIDIGDLLGDILDDLLGGLNL